MTQFKCPLCKGASSTVKSTLRKTTNNYVKSHHVSSTFLEIDLLECCSCGCISPSSQMNISTLNDIYIKTKASHNMGWNTFERTQHKGISDSKYLMYIDQSIGRLLDQYFNGSQPLTIGELGCPFISYSYTHKLRDAITPLSLSLQDHPSSLPSRLVKDSINILNQIVTLSWRLRQTLLGRRSPYSPPVNALSLKKILIHPSSVTYWSYGCIRYGQSCVQTALNNAVYDEVYAIDTPDQSGQFDMLTLINSFDHLDEPLATLNKIIHHTKSIYLLGHDSSSFGLQHRFAMTSRSIRYLQKLILSNYPSSTFLPLSFKSGPIQEIGFFCLLSK